MIQVKKTHDILTYGSFTLVDEENERVFAYLREFNDERMLIVGNLTDQTATLNLPETFIFSSNCVLLHNYNDRIIHVNELRPYEAFIVTL